MQQDAASPERPLVGIVHDAAALLDGKLAFWDAVAAWRQASDAFASVSLLSGPINMTSIDAAADALLLQIETWEARPSARDVFALQGATPAEQALTARVRSLYNAWQPGLRLSGKLLEDSFTAKYRIMLLRELAASPLAPAPEASASHELLWLRDPPEAASPQLEAVPEGDNAEVCSLGFGSFCAACTPVPCSQEAGRLSSLGAAILATGVDAKCAHCRAD